MPDMIWIVGPCGMETEKLYLETAEKLNELMEGRNWYYKSSFDKANRTAIQGRRGVGIEEGVKLLERAKSKWPEMRLTTDVHETHQVEKLKGLVDVIQIPAFLCRQTDLLVECGKHFDIVHVKKGQWISPESTKHFAGKIRAENPNAQVWITDRGSNSGYEKLFVDFAAVEEMKDYGDRVFLDCTHSTQRRKGDFTGGDRELACRYMVAAPIFGYTGIFAEVHPNPPQAYSDADCQIYLKDWAKLLNQFDKINEIVS
jgi:2-dehydro-3-deoxyphosphooctonate aldolase (KDO 8-P synthase)